MSRLANHIKAQNYRGEWVKQRAEILRLYKLQEDDLYELNQVANDPARFFIAAIRRLMDNGVQSQREIAYKIGVSQTRLSKYMNGTTRVRGWTSLEERLLLFFDEFYGYNAEQNEEIEDLNSLEASLSLESPDSSKDVSCESPNVAESDEEPDPWSHFSISMVVDQFSR